MHPYICLRHKCLGPRRLLLPMPCKHPDFIPFKHKINLLNAQTRSESVETSSGREQNHQRPSNVKSDGISGTAGVAGNEQGMSSSPSLYHHKHPTLSPDFSPLTRTPPHSPSLSPLVDPDHYSALSDIEDDDKDGRNAVPFFYLRKRMSRLHDMRNCYINIEKRTDRIKFLHQQLLASAKQEETIYNLGGQKTLSTHRSAGRGGLAAHSRAGYLKHLQPASSNKHKLNEIYQRFKPRAARRKSMIGASFSRPSVANISFSGK